MKKNHFTIIRKTAVVATDSLLTLQPGETVTVSCQEFAGLGTVQSAVCRLNQRAGYKQFEASSDDNGATITIKRYPQE